jgi:hypothetical protein
MEGMKERVWQNYCREGGERKKDKNDYRKFK